MIQVESFVRSQSGLYEQVIVSLNNDGMQKLRELRLWHRNQAMYYRSLANHIRPGIMSQNHIASSNEHIKFVQTLNNFFPVDDTADKDAMK